LNPHRSPPGTEPQTGPDYVGGTRRDILYLATASLFAIGTASFISPLIDSMNTSANVLVLASISVNPSPDVGGDPGCPQRQSGGTARSPA